MIRRLKYGEIDFNKYEECTENAVQKNFYAKKEILDALCEGWELLIVGDYDFVMPVPFIRKFTFKFVAMPVFIQQLGVFGKVEDEDVNEFFLQKLLSSYRVLSYSFNHHNTFKSVLGKRKNYIIHSQDYNVLYRNYFSKGRKSVLKKTDGLSIEDISMDHQISNFVLAHFKGVRKKSEIQMFLRFMFEHSALLQFLGVFFKGKLISLGVFTKNGEKYGLIALINNEKFKDRNAASYLLNEFLKKEISNKELDFMGGNIRGIEIFFKSFGANLTSYHVVQNSKMKMIKNLLKF